MKQLRRYFSYRYSIPLILLLLFGFVLSQGLKNDPTKLPSTLIGKPMPAMRLPDLLDQTSNLKASLQGKAAIINVWASWCQTCMFEHGVITKLASETDIPVYGIAYHDTPDAIHAFLTKFGNPYTNVWIDEAGRAAIDLGVYGTPETYIIDNKGIIRFRHAGLLTPKILKDEVLPMITQLKENPHA